MKPIQRRFDVAYLGLTPVVHKSEGLNVLLCDTICPLLDEGVKVVIHTTNRHFNSVSNAIEGNGIARDRLEIRVHRVGSLGISLHWAWINRRSSPRKVGKVPGASLLSILGSWLKRLSLWLLDITPNNFLLKLAAHLLIVFLGFIFASASLVLSIPVVLLFFVVGFIRRFFKLFITNLRRRPKIWGLLRRIVRRCYHFLGDELVRLLYSKEQIRFSKSVGCDRQVDRLFFFTAFDGYAVNAFRGKKLVVFPDAVTAMFPIRFCASHNRFVYDSMKLAIKGADSIICYSNFVRDNQLLKYFRSDVGETTINVIPQGYFLPNFAGRVDEVKIKLKTYSALVKNVFPMLMRSPPVVDFSQFDYIIYPTIDRPHKNTFCLLKAFEILLRKRHRNIKLLLTTPGLDSNSSRFVYERRLQYDVIFMPSVPVDVLNDLFRGASLMVHPSLAEGGDIFNFSRALSVGVPALLANVPVVREMFDRGGIHSDVYNSWLFDPYDPDALADKIQVALDTPDDLVKPQSLAFNNLSGYGFSEMADRYISVYESM